MYKSIFDGIIFIEGKEENAKRLGTVEYKKDSLYNNQLQNLDNVKTQLASKAKSLGANAIANFEYGQKNVSWFRSLLLAFDDNINWYGSGVAVKLDETTYQEYKEEIEKRN